MSLPVVPYSDSDDKMMPLYDHARPFSRAHRPFGPSRCVHLTPGSYANMGGAPSCRNPHTPAHPYRDSTAGAPSAPESSSAHAPPPVPEWRMLQAGITAYTSCWPMCVCCTAAVPAVPSVPVQQVQQVQRYSNCLSEPGLCVRGNHSRSSPSTI